jgi:hypothetical protein
VLSAVEYKKALGLSPTLAGLAPDYQGYRALVQATASDIVAAGRDLLLAFPTVQELSASAPGVDPLSALVVKDWLAGPSAGGLVRFQGSLDAAELDHRLSSALSRSFEVLGIDPGAGAGYAEELERLVRGAAANVVAERGNLWVVAVEEPGTAGALKVSLELRRVGGPLVLPSPAADTLLLKSCALALANDGFFFVADYGPGAARCCGWHITMDQTFAVSVADAERHYAHYGMGADLAGRTVRFFEPTVDDIFGLGRA